MNLTKIVEGRKPRPSHDYDPALSDPARRARVEGLLRAYPNANDAEIAEIRDFLANGQFLDVGLVSGSDEFKETVDAFLREQRVHARPSVSGIMVCLLVALGLIAFIWRYL